MEIGGVMAVFIISTALGVGGLYLRMATRESALAKWRGVIETKVDSNQDMITKLDKETAKLEDDIYRRLGNIEQSIGAIKVSLAHLGLKTEIEP